MGAARRSDPHRVIGFSFCRRYLGAAVYCSGTAPVLRPTRIKGHAQERAEHVRLGAWIERSIVRHEAELVAVMAPEQGDQTDEAVRAMLRAVVERNHLPFVELSRIEVARTLGAEMATSSAICSRLAAGHVALAAELRRKGVRSFLGPRTEAARYWAMPLLAFGAALCAIHLVAESTSA